MLLLREPVAETSTTRRTLDEPGIKKFLTGIVDLGGKAGHIDDGTIYEPQIPHTIDGMQGIHLETDEDEHALDIAMLLHKSRGELGVGFGRLSKHVF
jgi:hypothetical protein